MSMPICFNTHGYISSPRVVTYGGPRVGVWVVLLAVRRDGGGGDALVGLREEGQPAHRVQAAVQPRQAWGDKVLKARLYYLL